MDRRAVARPFPGHGWRHPNDSEARSRVSARSESRRLHGRQAAQVSSRRESALLPRRRPSTLSRSAEDARRRGRRRSSTRVAAAFWNGSVGDSHELRHPARSCRAGQFAVTNFRSAPLNPVLTETISTSDTPPAGPAGPRSAQRRPSRPRRPRRPLLRQNLEVPQAPLRPCGPAGALRAREPRCAPRSRGSPGSGAERDHKRARRPPHAPTRTFRSPTFSSDPVRWMQSPQRRRALHVLGRRDRVDRERLRLRRPTTRPSNPTITMPSRDRARCPAMSATSLWHLCRPAQRAVAQVSATPPRNRHLAEGADPVRRLRDRR